MLEQHVVARTRRLQETNARLEREIERRLRTEATLRDALTQGQEDLRYREVLIREVNHRTKNALQLAIGLLSVQANRAADVGIRDTLETAISRIKQINEVHTLLAHRSSPDALDLPDYLQRLSQGVAASFAPFPGHVKMKVDLEVDVAWKPEIVVPLGLIVGEALTNSFKHAFPDGRNGQIRIRLHVRRDGLMQLQVEDDGVGMPVDRQRGSLGLGLIEKFAQQVKGEATCGSRSDGIGTLVTVVFPHPGSVGHAGNATPI
jgi:two-component sensor histidine kinase